MEKKEFKVGEVFDAGLVRLTCSCIDIIVGPCGHVDRQDNKNVIFIKAD